jgi:hypothetical protein
MFHLDIWKQSEYFSYLQTAVSHILLSKEVNIVFH